MESEEEKVVSELGNERELLGSEERKGEERGGEGVRQMGMRRGGGR